MNQGKIFVPPFSFDRRHVVSVIRILQKHDPFAILGIEDESIKYSIPHYIFCREIQGRQINALLDRNIVSYCYQFLRRDMRTIDQQQLALSCLIFLNMFEAEFYNLHIIEAHHCRPASQSVQAEIVDWNLLMEFLHSNDIRYALELIATSQNMLPENYESRKQASELDHSEIQPPISWHSVYIHLLKMAEIQKNQSRGVDAVAEYLLWVAESYKSDAAAIYFAVIFFSEKEAHRRLFRDKRLIQNIAWDLTYIVDWFRQSRKNIEDNGPVNILVSHDSQLKQIAFCLARDAMTEFDSSEMFEHLLDRYYAPQSKPKLIVLFDNFAARLRNSSRQRSHFDDIEMKKELVMELEEILFGKARAS
jgi:hypothetical protein